MIPGAGLTEAELACDVGFEVRKAGGLGRIGSRFESVGQIREPLRVEVGRRGVGSRVPRWVGIGGAKEIGEGVGE